MALAATQDSVDWLLILTLMAVLLLLMGIRLWALWLGQELDRREIVKALAADPSNQTARPPIILFLRSFDVANVGLFAKFFSDFKALLGALLLMATHGPVGISTRFDAEEELDEAVGNDCLFIALGDKYASYGSSKIIVDDKDWQRTFYELAEPSALILIMPGPSASVLWEVSQLLTSGLIAKTLFIMPRAAGGEADTWAEFAAAAHHDLGLTIPHYDREGRALWLQQDHHTWKTTDLVGFTHTLAKYVKVRGASRSKEFDIEQLWQLL